MKALLLGFVLLAGCATDSASSMREAMCGQLCARVLHPMSLSRPEGPRSCTCWAPTASFEPSRPVSATIRITEMAER